METIFLRILESSTAPFSHKKLVLKLFLDICSDDQICIEFFLNYDCQDDDTDESALYDEGLFSRLVHTLCRQAQTNEKVNIIGFFNIFKWFI